MGVQDDGEREEANCPIGLEAEIISERFQNGLADIPDYRAHVDLEQEYRDFPEEMIWSPRDEVNEWVPFYVFMARSVLTFVQENRGIPNREAMENSCTGYAEQYITNVLHSSKYVLKDALKTLMTTELPRKLVTRWTAAEIDLFLEGIARHGKNFANIHKYLLPGRNTKEIVDFYYTWKWSEAAKAIRTCRQRRRHPRSKKRFPSIGCIFGELTSPRIVTRSVTVASKLLSKIDASPNASLPQTSIFLRTRKRKRSPIIR